MGQLFALGLQELDKTISTHCLIISEVAEDTEKIVFLPSHHQITFSPIFSSSSDPVFWFFRTYKLVL